MSNAMINLCWPVQLPPREKLLLIVLADAASDNGHSWQLVSSISVKMGLSSRGVQRAVASLEARGYVRRELRLGRSSVFYLIPEAIAASVLSEHRNDCNPASRSAEMAKGGDTSVTPPPTPVSPHPRHQCHPPPTPVSPTPDTSVTHNPFLTLKEPQTLEREGWEAFKNAYPNKSSMSEGRKAWNKLNPNAELRAVIMASVLKQSASDRWQDPQYVPHPATWLRGERWNDQLPVALGAAQSQAARVCIKCGEHATVFADANWHCRAHNPNRAAPAPHADAGALRAA